LSALTRRSCLKSGSAETVSRIWASKLRKRPRRNDQPPFVYLLPLWPIHNIICLYLNRVQEKRKERFNKKGKKGFYLLLIFDDS